MKTLISALGLSVSLALAPAVFAQENLEGELDGAMPKKEMPKMKIEELNALFKNFNMKPANLIGMYQIYNSMVLSYDLNGDRLRDFEIVYPIRGENVESGEPIFSFYNPMFVWRDENGNHIWDDGETSEVIYPASKENGHPPVDLSDKKPA